MNDDNPRWSRYDTEVDLTETNNSHTKLVNLVPRDSAVLEVGTATGYVSRILRDRGCRVIGIEVDPNAAEKAEPYCERIIVGDIEQLDLRRALGDERFDVIMFGDVLEHLREPVEVLKKMIPFVKPTGCVVASVPNVAHGSVRLGLLRGRFDYTETGLLDESHLRFFTRRSLAELIARSGYRITDWDATIKDVLDADVREQPQDLPVKLVDAIRKDPDAEVYQFVIRCEPSSEPLLSETGSDAGGGEVLAAFRANERELAELRESVALREREAMHLRAQLNEIVHSTGFKVLAGFRRTVRRIAPWGTRRGGFYTAFSRALHILRTEGSGPLLRRIPQWRLWLPRLSQRAPMGNDIDAQYEIWLQEHYLTPDRRKQMTDEISSMTLRPVVSVIMPVFNTDADWLKAAIDSVAGQLYPDWELCIVDDGSTRAETLAVLDGYEAGDDRIKVARSPANKGIVDASNQALRMATGEYVALLDHDDELRAEALFEVVRSINEDPGLDYIYTDEDRIAPDGRQVEPFFKPDWSPDLLLSLNYVTHLSVFRRSLVQELGGFRPGFDGAQDWDLQLRVTEATSRIGHVPFPLYSWRKIPGSTATSSTAKPYAYESARRAIEEALARRGRDVEVTQGAVKGHFRVRYRITAPPRVAILIPTRDRLEMLRRCIDSIERKTNYQPYEIVVIDNDSTDPETLEYLDRFGGRVIHSSGEFNYSKINNEAARETDSDVLVFLNNDTEVLNRDWLSAMVEHVQRPEVGAVGARLFFPDGNVQHEGVLVGPGNGLASHIDHRGYFLLGDVSRNLSAVTGACMATRREVFFEVGGFDEALGVAYNDIDLCLKMRELGYLIVYTPHALLRHWEGGTRGRVLPIDDARLFQARWSRDEIFRDPYYNPNLSLRFPFTIKTKDEELEEA